MAAQRAHLIGLLHGQYAGRVRSCFELWPDLLRARRFNDKIGARAGTAAARIASSRPQTVAGPTCQLTHTGYEVLSLHIRVQYIGGPHARRNLAPGTYGIDRDNLRSAGNPCSLYSA